MKVEKRTLNWLPRQSLWNEAVERRQKRREEAAAFVEKQATFASAVGSIQQNFVAGTLEVTSNVAAKRLGINLKA